METSKVYLCVWCHEKHTTNLLLCPTCEWNAEQSLNRNKGTK